MCCCKWTSHWLLEIILFKDRESISECILINGIKRGSRRLTFSWSLHLQLSAGQLQTIQVYEPLLPPGGRRPDWRTCREGRGLSSCLKPCTPNTGAERSWWIIPAATAGFGQLKGHLENKVFLMQHTTLVIRTLLFPTFWLGLSGQKSSILSIVLMSRFPKAICKPLSSPTLLHSAPSRIKLELTICHE